LMSVIIRSIISECVVSDIIKTDFRYDYLVEVLMAVIFVYSSIANSLWVGAIIYLTAFVGYMVYQWKFDVKQNR